MDPSMGIHFFETILAFCFAVPLEVLHPAALGVGSWLGVGEGIRQNVGERIQMFIQKNCESTQAIYWKPFIGFANFLFEKCWFFSSHNWSWLPLRLGSFTIGSVSTSMIMGGTVDGWDPAPVDMVNIPLFIGFHTSQVVQDFSHQHKNVDSQETGDVWPSDRWMVHVEWFYGFLVGVVVCFSQAGKTHFLFL